MKLITWNMKCKPDNWSVLAEMMAEEGATAAMVQEAVEPPAEVDEKLAVFGDPSLGDEGWRLPIPHDVKRRRFASAVAVCPGMQASVHPTRQLANAGYHDLAICHPGQWVAAEIGEGDEAVHVISLYGIWEGSSDRDGIYAEATVHRAISDITPLLQSRNAERIVLAGDLNVWRGYGSWKDRYQTVFDRLAALGLELAGPFRAEGCPPLEGCPCRQGDDCRHVVTYRWHSKETSNPYQLDFVFTRGVEVTGCVALDRERYWACSDHLPVVIDFGGR